MFYITLARIIRVDNLLEKWQKVLKDCDLSDLTLYLQHAFISAQLQSDKLSINHRFFRFIYKVFVRCITRKDRHIKDKISHWLTSLNFYTVLLFNKDIIDSADYGTLFIEQLYEYYNANEDDIEGVTKDDKLYHILLDTNAVKTIINRAISQYVAHIIGIIDKIMLDSIKYLFSDYKLQLLELVHVYHKDIYIEDLDVYSIQSPYAIYVNKQVIEFCNLMAKSYMRRNDPAKMAIDLIASFINLTYTHEIITNRLYGKTKEYEKIFNPISYYIWRKVVEFFTILAKYRTSKDDWFIINLSPYTRRNSKEKKNKAYYSNDIKGSWYYIIERYGQYVQSMPEFEKVCKMRKNKTIKSEVDTIGDLLTEMQYYFELDNLKLDMMKV